MLFIRQGATHKVVLGPAVAVGDGFTPVTNLDISTADDAEAILHDNGTVVDISGYTCAAIATADGYYHLTLQNAISGTVGHLTIVINDDDLILPLRADFTVLDTAPYDANFKDAAAGPALATDVTTAHSTTDGLVNGLNDFDPANDAVANVTLVGTTTTNTDLVSAAAVVNEWETQSQADPTGFHVNLQEWLGTAPAALSDTDKVQSDMTAIHGTALTETAGQLAGRFVDFFDQASAAYSVVTALADFKATGFSTHSAANVWAVGTRVLTANTNFNDLDASATLAALGMASANLDTQLADIPTVAEMEARTLVTASYFDPANDAVASVTLVDTTTTNTDLVTAAAIKTALEANGSKLDHLWETTEDDSGTRRFTENGLEQAPSGTGASAASIWAYATRSLTAKTGFSLAGTSLGLGPTAMVTNTDGIYMCPTGGTVALYKRVRIWDGTDAQQADISSITYSIFGLDPDDEDTREEVEGHVDVDVSVAATIYDALQTNEGATNFNFLYIPVISTNAAFSDTGTWYLVEYKITPASGELIIERFKVKAI